MTTAFLQAVSSIGLFVLLAIPGFLFLRKHWLSSAQLDGLSTVLVQYLWPIMVIDAMAQTQRSQELLQSSGYITAVTLAGILLAAGLGFGLLRLEKQPFAPGGIMVFALMFSNTGLIGMPLISYLLGSEALFLASIVELVNDILIFSVGLLLMQRSCRSAEPLSLCSLFSPGFVGMLLGLFLFLSGLPLPALLRQALHMIASATTPVTMFLVGGQLAEQSLSSLLKQRRLYRFAAWKLLLLPGLLFVLLRVILREDSLASSVLILLFAMPSGACCALFARQYHGDQALATGCVMLTTLFSLLTLPLWMVLCSL